MANDLVRLGDCLCSREGPIGKQMNAVFLLKSLGGEDAIDQLKRGMDSDSVLLKHEIAYVLGQMQDSYANEFLISVLSNEKEDPIVRHEAAEALGAIGDEESLPVLEKYQNHHIKEISETCSLAISLINQRRTLSRGVSEEFNEPFTSVDPAPPETNFSSIEDLQHQLMDTTKSLFDRYKAMFALRNLMTDESVLALCKGFKDSSALFRHEIAYVLGQMQRPVSIEYLVDRLVDVQEHDMVRHEAAEALGAIEGEKVPEILSKYRKDDRVIIAESCDVALDIHEYWEHDE